MAVWALNVVLTTIAVTGWHLSVPEIRDLGFLYFVQPLTPILLMGWAFAYLVTYWEKLNMYQAVRDCFGTPGAASRGRAVTVANPHHR